MEGARSPPPSLVTPPPTVDELTIAEKIGRMSQVERSHFMCREAEWEASLLPNPWLSKVTKEEEVLEEEEEEEDRSCSPRTLGQSLDEMYEAFMAPPPVRFFGDGFVRRDCFGSGFV